MAIAFEIVEYIKGYPDEFSHSNIIECDKPKDALDAARSQARKINRDNDSIVDVYVFDLDKKKRGKVIYSASWFGPIWWT